MKVYATSRHSIEISPTVIASDSEAISMPRSGAIEIVSLSLAMTGSNDYFPAAPLLEKSPTLITNIFPGSTYFRIAAMTWSALNASTRFSNAA